MSEITLVIPAKKEPNSLPQVLKEIRQQKLDCKIIVVLDKDDSETFGSIKNLDCKIIYVKTSDYNNLVIRPKFAVTSKERIMKTFNFKIKDWKYSLKEYLRYCES